MRTQPNGAILLTLALVFTSGAIAQNSTNKARQEAAAASPEAPKPRKFDPRDIDGVWLRQTGIIYSIKEPPLTPWARANLRRPAISHGQDNAPGGDYPDEGCAPVGVPSSYSEPRPFEFVTTPKRIFQFFELQHMWREIWMDGRTISKDADPTYLGYSVGHWEGNTLVVDTSGFNDKTWIEENYPYKHTEAFHLIERFHLIDRNDLEIDFTFDDTKAFTHPWTGIKQMYQRRPTWEIQEALCNPEDDRKFDELIGNPEVETFCADGKAVAGKCLQPGK